MKKSNVMSWVIMENLLSHKEFSLYHGASWRVKLTHYTVDTEGSVQEEVQDTEGSVQEETSYPLSILAVVRYLLGEIFSI